MKRPRATLSFFTSAVLLALLGASCTVTTDDDDDDGTEFVCNEGESRDCTCSGGLEGTQSCSTGRTRFNACFCEGSGEGGTSGGGTTGGGGTTPVAGAAGESGGAGGAAGSAGEGGVGGEGGGAAICDEPVDDCESCIFSRCCAEYSACLGSSSCSDELGLLLACIDDARQNTPIGPDFVEPCADEVTPAPGFGDLNPRTRAVLDCMGGDPNWPNLTTGWPTDSCAIGCFDRF